MKKLKHKASIRQMDNKDRLNKKSYQIDFVRTVFDFETYVCVRYPIRVTQPANY